MSHRKWHNLRQQSQDPVRTTPQTAEWPWASQTQSLGLSFPRCKMELLPSAVAHPLHADLSQSDRLALPQDQRHHPRLKGGPTSSSFKGRDGGAGQLAERTGFAVKVHGGWNSVSSSPSYWAQETNPPLPCLGCEL